MEQEPLALAVKEPEKESVPARVLALVPVLRPLELPPLQLERRARERAGQQQQAVAGRHLLPGP